MSQKSKAPLITLIISAAVVLILLMTTGGSMYTVDQGERGVVLAVQRRVEGDDVRAAQSR